MFIEWLQNVDVRMIPIWYNNVSRNDSYFDGESFSWEGARVSKQKKLITEILAASYAHPTASQIFEEARKRMPNIALGTVYRNLGVLVDEGTIVRLSVTKFYKYIQILSVARNETKKYGKIA